MTTTHEIVICGAGIAGVSAAYHLAVRHGIKNVCLVDERPPLTLTSDSSTECYRNWWPGPGEAMVALMNRSVDLMEALAQESHNVFHLNRRGYLYLTANPDQIPSMLSAAQEISRLGAGPLLVHRGAAGDPEYQASPAQGFDAQLNGADLLLDPGLIHRYYPTISERVVAALHVRRAGWFSAQQLGMHLLEGGRAHGVKLVNDKIIGVEQHGGRVTGVRLEGGGRLATGSFVNAAGPMLKNVGRLMDIDLPVYCELHQKAAINDPLSVVPRDAPLLIWNDPVRLEWSADERAELNSESDMRWLLDKMPAGVHTRPEGSAGSTTVLMLWEYRSKIMEPTWPLPLDLQYPEIALRGLATMLPRLKPYLGKMPRPSHDGGYYTRTSENRPLIGRLPLVGAYIIGALSGYGLMASCAAGELLAAHVSGSKLPAYTPAFELERYEDPEYLEEFKGIGDSGQL
jgi:glycine/D-amino acid oxidase-like deaminating enzyme